MSKLVDLRARYGHALVDELLQAGILTRSPLSAAALIAADELLAWQPRVPPRTEQPEPVARLEPQSLLADDLPAAARRLADACTLQDAETDSHYATARHLVSLARRAYPAYVAAAQPQPLEPAWGPMRLRGPEEHRQAVAAMRAEAELACLWEADDIATSCGRTEAWFPRYDPVELLLHGAWRLCLLRGEWTAENLRDAVLEQLHRLRAASLGHVVEVPVFLGFGHARISVPVSEASVHVRPYRGLLQGWLFGASDRLDDHGGGFIVERSLPWTFCASGGGKVLGPAAATVPTGLSEHEWHRFGWWADCLAVAIAMAETSGPLKPHQLLTPQVAFSRAPQLRWVFTGDPLVGGKSLHYSQGWSGLACPCVPVDPSILHRTSQLEAIADVPTSIAIERLSAALEQPRSHRDCLLDAVIAWEALSGDCHDAVTAKVSAIMAHLVAELADRRQVRKRIAKIYGTRSSIVHGGVAEVRKEERDAANVVAVTALRSLVDAFPHLIGQSDRFERLFLDGA